MRISCGLPLYVGAAGDQTTDKDRGLGTVTAPELGQDVAHVCVDGTLGDE
jgi:hypothetical protein